MTILEKLREWKREIEMGANDELNAQGDLLEKYDLALENALLKLGNRGVQIADLKARLKGYQGSIELIYDIINDEKIDADETIASISKIVKDN